MPYAKSPVPRAAHRVSEASPAPYLPEDAPKKRLNLSVNAALLERAKDSGLNLSRLFEETLVTQLRKTEAQRWAEDNREAIAAYNERVDREGLWNRGITPWYR